MWPNVNIEPKSTFWVRIVIFVTSANQVPRSERKKVWKKCEHRYLLLLTDGRVVCSECGSKIDSATITDQQLKLQNTKRGSGGNTGNRGDKTTGKPVPLARKPTE